MSIFYAYFESLYVTCTTHKNYHSDWSILSSTYAIIFGQAFLFINMFHIFDLAYLTTVFYGLPYYFSTI